MSNQSTPAHVIYKDAPGFPGYRVGDDGSVWSGRNGGHPGDQTWRQLKPITKRWKQYLQVSLYAGGRHCCRFVHRLVLEAFIGPRPSGQECRHLDGNRQNNHLTNLCWGTPSENREDQRRHGTLQFVGETHPMNTGLTAEKVRAIRVLAGLGWSHQRLAGVFDTTPRTISRIVRRLSWVSVP